MRACMRACEIDRERESNCRIISIPFPQLRHLSMMHRHNCQDGCVHLHLRAGLCVSMCACECE